MKKLLNALSVDLRKIIFSYGFWLCIIVTFLLCFSSVIYTQADTGKEYTVLEVLAERSKLSNIEFASFSILHYSVSPYITIFLPVLSSIPFVTVFCAERLGGNQRFVITRTGKLSYCISKFVSAVISGALAVTLGFMMYAIAINCLFQRSGAVLDYAKIFVGMLLYGAVSVLPAFFLASFIRNKYMICCFPFIFMHFYYTVISKLQDIFNSKGMDMLTFKIYFLFPSMLKDVFMTSSSDNIINVNVYAAVYYTALAILAFVGFTAIMNRRLDYGQ